MRILTIMACLLIAACNVTYAADNDGAAVKKTIPDHEKLGEWGEATMLPEDSLVDGWVRRWMDRDRTEPFELQVERTFGSFNDSFPPAQEFPPSGIDSVGGIPIVVFPLEEPKE